jgi:hypothetical protein
MGAAEGCRRQHEKTRRQKQPQLRGSGRHNNCTCTRATQVDALVSWWQIEAIRASKGSDMLRSSSIWIEANH